MPIRNHTYNPTHLKLKEHKMLPTAPQLLSLVEAVYILRRDPLIWAEREKPEENIHSLSRLRNVLRSIYRLLRFAPATFAGSTRIGSLYPLLTYSDRDVRTYAAYAISHLLNLPDFERRAFLEQYAWDDGRHPVLIRREEDDFDLFEQSQLFVKRQGSEHLSPSPLTVTATHLLPETVDMGGTILAMPNAIQSSNLSESNELESKPQSLVATPTTQGHLSSIGIALSLEFPILLEGPPGVGKTALVEEAARLGGCKELLKIHIGDQTDSKILLGTYVCTSTPGAFRWQPGVLATAVAEGRWVLIEDIDLAPLEVMAILLPLLETRYLFIASRGERIRAKEDFRIFATRTQFTGSASNAKHLAGQNLWRKIVVQRLPNEEVLEVLSHRYGSLAHLLPEILSAFSLLAKHLENQHNRSRYLSLRDLLKWCRRIDAMRSAIGDPGNELDLAVREDLFREAVESFAAMLPRKEARHEVCMSLGSALQVPAHRVQFYVDSYLPSLSLSGTEVAIGRASLKRCAGPDNHVPRPFAATSLSLCLLERLAVCVNLVEPVLLVGETGTGKTTVVQHLADLTRHNLVAINMSQQSDSSDLLGGFKPVDARVLAAPIKEIFDGLFERTFNVSSNQTFVDMIRKAFVKKNWGKLIVGFKNAIGMAKDLFGMKSAGEGDVVTGTKRKRRKVLDSGLQSEWEAFTETVQQFEAQYEQIKNNFLFAFVEGTLVKAIRQGHWVLLDEINLASPETLECLAGLLQGPDGSVMLMERGDTVPIQRHPDFRLFACMNPANDAGKRDLPPGLRSRFTEFWVDSPDANRADLMLIIRRYLENHLPPAPQGEQIVADIATFFVSTRDAAGNGELFDGANQRVHISMRTLTRALSYAVQVSPTFGLRRAIYEGMCMTFMTALNKDSTRVVSGFLNPLKVGVSVAQIPRNMLLSTEGSGNFALDKQSPGSSSTAHVLIDSFWLQRGPLDVPEDLEKTYVLTPSVEGNLRNLARAVMSKKYPVLIQGPTSAGKTSMVEYLARKTGHRFVRINNHEHTDLQEYLGSYVGDENGRLIFQEGILVEALRHGYWIVLDELNLAPSDVLEALNRLLDDNRELLIPETQEIVRPHPHFMLFATQNPAGQYGGRKQLSRAFRNRFLELHFEDIPESELETILGEKCLIAPSYAKRLVQVYRALQNARGRGRVFEGRHGFVTLRDMFRWAMRRAEGYERLAEDGYMLLAERMRRDDDKTVVKEVIERVMKHVIDTDKVYEDAFQEAMKRFCGQDGNSADLMKEVVWTKSMRRLFVLVFKCVEYREPVLLVGDTGCGKTTVCQLLAALIGIELRIVNAHQNTETADFLGSQRPARGRENLENDLRLEVRSLLTELADLGVKVDVGEEQASGELFQIVDSIGVEAKRQVASLPSGDPRVESVSNRLDSMRVLRNRTRALFEWHDGPLVQAMRLGELFLLDEISLADDSVLERLNSVLEPQQLLVLAEKGGREVEELYGADGFRFLATMNPGGDYGKKELSPALRNRFTEVWVPPVFERSDCRLIIGNKLSCLGHEAAENWADRMLDFVDWFAGQLKRPRESVISLRDILAWAGFILSVHCHIGMPAAFVHGGCLVFVDGIGVNPLFGMVTAPEKFRGECKMSLAKLVGMVAGLGASAVAGDLLISRDEKTFAIGPFAIELGLEAIQDVQFAMQAPTTLQNSIRVLRALQLRKAVLLEGSPGVGKTSLVSNLAAVTGHKLVRINLSEQTDLMDLFGSDLPVEGGGGGEFAWRDGPFLKAMREGSWVLLDELNLASQQVLEGLNACLDHRAMVYIPELDRTFGCHSEFRVFAAQNPQNQGGGRKGLPRSFVNRFTQVYVDALTEYDLNYILQTLHPAVNQELLSKMIRFNERMKEETMEKCTFGWKGAPWEFNLRDVMRWVELVKADGIVGHPEDHLEIVYLQRMRTREDREKVCNLYEEVFGETPSLGSRRPFWQVLENWIQFGSVFLERKGRRGVPINHLQLLSSSLPVLSSLARCVKNKWLTVLVGPEGTGKTSLVRLLAGLVGERLKEFSMNPGVDAVELLGGFEQTDLVRREQAVSVACEQLVSVVSRSVLQRGGEDGIRKAHELNHVWEQVRGDYQGPAVEQFLETVEDIIENCNIDLQSEGIPTTSDVLALVYAYRTTLAQGAHGKFEWIDGTLIRALEDGHWILIDNVNLCPASVLDRLNSLFEPGGVLINNERGLVNGEVKIIRPHPNFRIFMTMDPRFGEVSRAMRNRAVEIYLSSEPHTDATLDVDYTRILNGVGLLGLEIPASLIALLEAAQKQVQQSGDEGGVRTVAVFGTLLVGLLRMGNPWDDALLRSLREAYPELDVSAEHISSTVQHAVQIGHTFSWMVNQSGSVSPTLSWFPIFGRLMLEHSMLASVIASEAPLDYLLTMNGSSHPNSDLSDLVHPVPSTLTLLKAARYLFLDELDTNDIRSQISKFNEQSKDSFTFALLKFMKNGQGFPAEFVRSMEEELGHFASIPQPFLRTPLLRNNPTINTWIVRAGSANLQRLWDGYSQTFALRSLRRRLFANRWREEQSSREAEIVGAGRMNVAQQSYAYHQGLLSESQLVHPGVGTLWPLLNALHCALEHLMDKSLTGATARDNRLFVMILNQYDHLWASMQDQSLHIEKLSVAIRRLGKYMGTNNHARFGPTVSAEEDFALQLDCALKEATKGLRLFEVHISSRLYKHAGIVGLKTLDLYQIEAKFRGLAAKLELDGSDVVAWLSHPYVEISEETRRTITEGLSTVYQMGDMEQGDKQSLLGVLQRIAHGLEEQLRKTFDDQRVLGVGRQGIQFGGLRLSTVEHVPLQQVIALGARAAHVSVWAVADIAALKQEMCVLSDLMALMTADNDPFAVKVELSRMTPILEAVKLEALRNTSRNPADMEPYQHLIWLAETNAEAPLGPGTCASIRAVLQDAVYKWHRALWMNSGNHWALAIRDRSRMSLFKGTISVGIGGDSVADKIERENFPGPSLLRTALTTIFDIHLLAPMDEIPIHGFHGKARQNKLLLDFYASSKGKRTILDEYDLSLLIGALQQYLESYATYFSTGTMAEIRSILTQLAREEVVDSYVVQLQKLRHLCSGVESGALRHLFIAFVQPAISCISHAIGKTSAFQRCIGEAWLYVSLAFLRSYVPHTPTDPASGPATKLGFLEDEAAALRAEIIIRGTAERLSSGNVDNEAVRQLLMELDTLKHDRLKWSRRIALRPEKSQIAELHNDLVQLNHSVLGKDTVLSLLSDLRNHASSMALRESSLQATLTAVVDRMETKYPMYRDLLQPIFLAVYQFKYGLRLLMNSCRNSNLEMQTLETLQQAFLQFITDDSWFDFSVAGVLHTMQQIPPLGADGGNPTEERTRVILAMLSRINAIAGVKGSVTDKMWQKTHKLFGGIVDMWSAAEAARLTRLREEEETFKYKEVKHEVGSEDVLLDGEFREAFPDFSAAFADLATIVPEEGAAVEPQSDVTAERKDVEWDNRVAQDIRLLHLYLITGWDSAVAQPLEIFSARWSRAYEMSFNSAANLASGISSLCSSSVDTQSHQGRNFMCDFRTKQLHSTTDDAISETSAYDFYKDASIAEAQKIVPLLTNLDQRICELLEQWPEHTVLQQITVLSSRIAGFSLTSPIMKLLTGLEILLGKCHDWEAYASREVSINVNIEEINQLIIRWRKLELSCWRQLLDLEDRNCERKASNMWFHLWKVIFGVLGTDTERHIVSLLILLSTCAFSSLTNFQNRQDTLVQDELFAALDEFCSSSTLGEFSTRLQMLHTFYLHAKLSLRKDVGLQNPNSAIVANVLRNVHQYYSQFESEVGESVKKLRAPISKELSEYVKIASWKDVNVYALKESAARTHHHLHKHVRKYREVLKRPVIEVFGALQKQSPIDVGLPSEVDVGASLAKEHHEGAAKAISDVPVVGSDSPGGRVQQLNELGRRMKRFARQEVTATETIGESCSLNDFATAILERSIDFQRLNASLEGGSKTAKNEKTIRKKAFVDLLKQLARLGISLRCVHRYTNQREPAFIHALPVLDIASDENQPWLSPHLVKLWAGSNEYYYRNLVCISQLRLFATSHSADVTSDEVEKASSSVEHLLHVIIEERRVWATFAASLRCLTQLSGRLAHVHADVVSGNFKSVAPILLPSDWFVNGLRALKGATDEALVMCSQALMLPHIGEMSNADVIVHLQEAVLYLKQGKGALDGLYLESVHCDSTVFSTSSSIVLREAFGSYKGALERLTSNESLLDNETLIRIVGVMQDRHRELTDFNQSLLDLPFIVDDSVANVSAASGFANELIKLLLSSFQQLMWSQEPDEDAEGLDEFGFRAHYITRCHEKYEQMLKGVQVESIVLALNSFLAEVDSLMSLESRSWASQTCARMYPLIHQFILMLQYRLGAFLLYHRSVAKLLFILSKTFGAIFRDGYCVPSANSEEQDETGQEESATGTGIGEGAGAKDVSDEIENTDQVEGMQNESGTDSAEQQHIPEEDSAMEMDLDFDGNLEDVEQPDNGDDGGAQSGEDEAEEQMGDLGGKGNVVDEKLWGEEGADEGGNESTEPDAPVNSLDSESETVAKEDAGPRNDGSEERKDERKEEVETDRKDEDGSELEAEADTETDMDVNQPDRYEESHGFDIEQAENADSADAHEEEEKDVQLPENMEIEGEDSMSQLGEDNNESIDEPPLPDGEGAEGQPDFQENDASPDLENDSPEPLDNLKDTVDEAQNPSNEEGDSGSDITHGVSKEEPMPEEDVDMNGGIDVGQLEESMLQQLGEEGQHGQQSRGIDGQHEIKGPDISHDRSAADAPLDTGGSSRKEMERNSLPQNQQSLERLPNPRRSLGDALKNWMKRLRALTDAPEVDDAGKNDENEVADGGDRGMDFEFVEEDQHADGQVLNVATDEQMKNVDRSALVDNGRDDEEEQSHSDMMEIDQPEAEQVPKERNGESPEGPSGPSDGTLRGLELKQEDGPDAQTGPEEEVPMTEGPSDDDIVNPVTADRLTGNEVDESSEILDEDIELVDAEAYDTLRQELEQSLAEWRENGGTLQHAQELWRQYGVITRNLSFELCEQLRLILEPTLATKLKGDYRTGKRLNMRKVIPYIASQFKKDKIWLRRTKPSKRTYQIMIAIDDSKSMAESRSVQLAYESLALITQALTQLEVGEVSVVSFGQDVKLLHPFERTFSDQAGADVIQRFTFEQNRTDVLRMMTSTLGIMEQARTLGIMGGVASGEELWQLQLVISDGICEDHSRIQSLVRKAMELRIMVVFLILDPRDSISGLTNVTYPVDAATGLPTVRMGRYMDTFPFDYFVLVKDVGSLPEVLSDTLRQYFSFVSV
ncbi:AAA ATPase midasin [Rhizophlyctis rosea]|uniref:Midasin n=1 Tax=Rhizophlyctis rosea TaxID=64517 RepID=A0AAD5X977_9FUNG|nr:AAA ATPase midasin [Rhizophlyctis rosea]